MMAPHALPLTSDINLKTPSGSSINPKALLLQICIKFHGSEITDAQYPAESFVARIAFACNGRPYSTLPLAFGSQDDLLGAVKEFHTATGQILNVVPLQDPTVR
jgi:hypothetical protein